MVCQSVKWSNIMQVNIKVDRETHAQLSCYAYKKTRATKVIIRDTLGDIREAICYTSTSDIADLGIKESNLFKSNLNQFAADRSKLTIVGCIPVKIFTQR